MQLILPTGRALPSRVWEARHRGILIFLWLHVPVLVAVGVLTHHSLGDSLLSVLTVSGAAAFASWPSRSRAARSAAATFGLVTCSALLVHLTGGLIEMHFHFFVVVGVITLYQDWIPFGVAIGFTVLEHGLVGVLAPDSVYNHHAAQHNPWLWALIHGAFVLALCVPLVLVWRQNEDQALRDPLTRLSNRTLFAERLEQALKRRRHEAVAVLFIDLDHFKQVNDTLGHAAGDELLVACARRLPEELRDEDVVARLGGDEFAVILEGRSAARAEDVAKRLLRATAVPTVVSGHEITMSASIGIAHAERPTDAQEVLRNADLAMYVAKSSGRGQYQVYDESMYQRATDQVQLHVDLRQAIAADDLTVACQPIVDIATEHVTGVEILARWTHPERGDIAPDVFIPLAERSALIMPLGRFVFSQACRVAVQLAEIDPSLSVSVNVSTVQLADEKLTQTFAELLARYAVDASRIVVEVTETVLMHDLEVAARRLRDLKDIGLRVAVDDFGVGHSSLSYLRSLPVDILKIDKSFVDALPGDADLARVMIQLGHMRGLEIIAEGVETAEQRDALVALECDRAQGFLYGRPMSSSALVRRFSSGQLVARPRTRT